MPAMSTPVPAKPRPESIETPVPAGPAVARKPRVCFVAPQAWAIFSGDTKHSVAGGAEVQISLVAEALARRGYDVSMICLDYGQPDGIEVRGVKVYKSYTPDEGLPVVRFIHPRLTKLWAAMKRADADVYYQRTSGVETAWVAAFTKRHGRYSIFAGASDVDFVPGKQDIALARDRRIFEWGVRHVDRIFCQNEVQQRTLRENFGRDGIVIPNCMAPSSRERAGRHGQYVLWVAILRHSKRAEMFLELARRLPQYKFVMIGGPEAGSEAFFEKVRADAATIPNLDFKGYMPFAEAEKWFDGARVFVNTSKYEGFPNTFLQAWSRGLPTVAFFDTGSRVNGQPAYDQVETMDEMAARVDRLMHEDILWQQSSHRAEAFFRQSHSLDAIVEHYEHELARAPVRP